MFVVEIIIIWKWYCGIKRFAIVFVNGKPPISLTVNQITTRQWIENSTTSHVYIYGIRIKLTWYILKCIIANNNLCNVDICSCAFSFQHSVFKHTLNNIFRVTDTQKSTNKATAITAQRRTRSSIISIHSRSILSVRLLWMVCGPWLCITKECRPLYTAPTTPYHPYTQPRNGESVNRWKRFYIIIIIAHTARERCVNYLPCILFRVLNLR